MKNKIRKTFGAERFRAASSNKTRGSLFQFSLTLAVFLVLFSASFLQAQNLPDEIRGYKVSKADITVKNKNDRTDAKNKSEAFVNVGEPELTAVSLTGAAFEISAEVDALEQSGTVDFLTFKDFRVNGRAVDIEEYPNSFDIKKNQLIVLPKPIKVFVNSAQGLLGAVSEIADSKEEWTVTGRVFIFGKFKKWGMKFKRVVPVDVNIRIKNPVKNSADIL